MLKRLLSKLRKEKKDYPNRFLKFYHQNRKRLIKERRGNYKENKKQGVCVRCSKKALEGIVFCKYHQMKQKEYNRKARSV